MKSLVFPGQGSQYVGMGKDLLDSFPEIKVTFDEVNDALDQNLSRLMFDGPEDKLILTENAQPAIMSIGIATIEILKSRGFVVDKMIEGVEQNANNIELGNQTRANDYIINFEKNSHLI